jgi:hypothetical protein
MEMQAAMKHALLLATCAAAGSRLFQGGQRRTRLLRRAWRTLFDRDEGPEVPAGARADFDPPRTQYDETVTMDVPRIDGVIEGTEIPASRK